MVEVEPRTGEPYRERQTLVDPAQDPISYTRALPHPDVQDHYFLGTLLDSQTQKTCETLFFPGSAPPNFSCSAPGPYQVSLDGSTGLWVTEPFPSSGLPNGGVLDLAWGGDDRSSISDPSPHLKLCFADLYAATNGSGVQQWGKWWLSSNPCD